MKYTMGLLRVCRWSQLRSVLVDKLKNLKIRENFRMDFYIFLVGSCDPIEINASRIEISSSRDLLLYDDEDNQIGVFLNGAWTGYYVG